MFNLLRIWVIISVSLCAVFVTETTNVYEIFYAVPHEKNFKCISFFHNGLLCDSLIHYVLLKPNAVTVDNVENCYIT